MRKSTDIKSQESYKDNKADVKLIWRGRIGLIIMTMKASVSKHFPILADAKANLVSRFVLKGPCYNPLDVMNCLMTRRGYKVISLFFWTF